MDFELNEDQQAIIEAVERLLEQQAGPARAIELNKTGAYDDALDQALAKSGFNNIVNDMARDDNHLAGLEATLVVESIARAAGTVSCGAQLMVVPVLSSFYSEIKGIATPIALCTEEVLISGSPIRYSAQAKTLLVLCGLNSNKQDVKIISLNESDISTVRTSFGYPFGKPANALSDKLKDAKSLGPQAAQIMQDWWRLSLAAEAVGTMEAALNHTVEYVKQRRQFGRAIGSFQAIQHRLALCSVRLEGSRWLSREAAYHGAKTEAVATAASFALDSADMIFTEGHQMSGAIGFTHEFDLHVWTMRLQALRQELNGVTGHRKALVAARWG